MKKLLTLFTLLLTVCSGAWANKGDILFSQSFDATGAGSVAYAANTARSYTTAAGKGLATIVGSEDNMFTSIQCGGKSNCGIGINSSTGGNSEDWTGKFGAYYNNTGAKWSIIRTSNLAETAPEAVKITFDALLAVVDNGTSKQAVQFIVGSDFADGGYSYPENSKIYTGFGLLTGSSSSKKHAVCKMGSTTLVSSSEVIDYNTMKSFTWVINNTEDELTYKDPSGNDQTLGSQKWDLWIGTTRIVTGVSRTTTGSSAFSGSSIQNIFIGSTQGVKHEFHIDNIVVTDLTPSAAPATPTCATPTITVDNTFNFEHKGYAVTITNTEGETLKVSTDGETYTTQTSPYVTYATTTTHYYAKSVKASYDDSEVADEIVTNTFDGGKKYIAWVYTDDYASKDDVNDKYHFNNDPMVTALQTNYNVVAVNYAASATPSNDLNNADLVVLTEAVSGSAAMTKAMKGFVGNVPMINMKFFAYTNENARWQWGTPANPGTATTKITPNSKLYKVLNGVTFDGDDISLYSQISSTKNANGIQTVEWLDEPVNFVSSNTDMAVTNSKVSMHAGTKFFGIGLSCDSRSYYNENAFTIIKNAAAMLIAGEDLTTEVATVPVTIGASGYASYCSSYALDFTETGVTAYTAKVEEEKVVLTKVTDNIVPANEGVVLRGVQNDYNIPVATTDDSFDFSENQMVGVVQRTQVVWNVGGKYNYILQQGQFNMANGGYLKANRAYLSTTYNVEAQGGAKPLTIVFNDEEQGEETDGIKSVQGSGFTVNGEAYNLSGQRVGADYKGLVIINGKKVIRK